MGDPYGEPFRVRAQSGLLVMFPSWLYHWVHPYAGETPRIAISFNASIGAHAVDKAGISKGRAATVATDMTHQFPANVIGRAATGEDLNSHADKV